MPKRLKVQDNLFKIGDVYYYRKGALEHALGEFSSDKKAIEYKIAFEQKRDTVGAEAFGFRAKEMWVDYFKECEQVAAGAVDSKRTISSKTLLEKRLLWGRHLGPYFGKRRLSEIDDVLWSDYVHRASVRDLTNHRKLLKHFLKWCMKQGKIRFLPICEVPKVKRRKRKILTPDQIKALFSHSDGWIKVFNTLYLIQGMRWGEIMGLRWSDIDFDSHTINIRDETTRTRSGRPVPLNKLAAAVLTDHLREQQAQGRKTDWVFPSRWDDSKPMNYGSPRKEWIRVIKLAGLSSLGVRPHDLRATAEYYANKLAHFTDMQREKMFGSSIKTQSRHYVTFNAEDIRGLEESVRFDGLENALQSPQLPEQSLNEGGKIAGKRKVKTSRERLKDE